MSSLTRDMFSVIDTLLAAIPESLLLQCQLSGLSSLLQSLKSAELPAFFEQPSNAKLTFKLSCVMRLILRLLHSSLIPPKTSREELTLLHRASVLLQIHSIQHSFAKLVAEIQHLVVSTALFSLPPFRSFLSSLSPEILALTMATDFEQIKKMFIETFQVITEIFGVNKQNDIGNLGQKCLQIMQEAALSDENKGNDKGRRSVKAPNSANVGRVFPRYELFDDDIFEQTANTFVDYLLSLDPQSQQDRFLTTESLKMMSVDDKIKDGSFGGIFLASMDLSPPSASDNNNNLTIINSQLALRQSLASALSVGSHKTSGSVQRFCLQQVTMENLDALTTRGKLALAAELSSIVANSSSERMNLLGFTLTINDAVHGSKLFIAMRKLGISLVDILHIDSNNSIETDPNNSEEGNNMRNELGHAEILSIMLNVVKGVEFLHSKGIVHGAIRPENIYISSANPAREAIATLTNFSYGLNTLEEEKNWNEHFEGGFEYHAPEVLSKGEHTTASDVFSLAICLWEMSQADRLPYDHFPNKRELALQIKSGERPTWSLSRREPGWVIQLAKLSWVGESWNRPPASKWRSFFERVVEQRKIQLHHVNRGLAKELDKTENGNRVYKRMQARLSQGVSVSSKMLSVFDSVTMSNRTLLMPQAANLGPSVVNSNRSLMPPSATLGGSSQQSLNRYSNNRPPGLQIQKMNSISSNGNVSISTIPRTRGIEHIRKYDDRKAARSNAKQPDGASGNGRNNSNPSVVDVNNEINIPDLTQELTTFYEKHDQEKLDQIPLIITYAQKNGLALLNEVLCKEYNEGLQQFRKSDGESSKIKYFPMNNDATLKTTKEPEEENIGQTFKISKNLRKYPMPLASMKTLGRAGRNKNRNNRKKTSVLDPTILDDFDDSNTDRDKNPSGVKEKISKLNIPPPIMSFRNSSKNTRVSKKTLGSVRPKERTMKKLPSNNTDDNSSEV